MPTIDLVIGILRLMECDEVDKADLYSRRCYLDKTLSSLHPESSNREIIRAIDSIDDEFYSASPDSKELVRRQLIGAVLFKLKGLSTLDKEDLIDA